MYFPDLKSLQSLAKSMRNNKGEKKYTGIIPYNEAEVPEAREALAKYIRDVWKDEIMALEIENAVTKENYSEVMSKAIEKKSFDFI